MIKDKLGSFPVLASILWIILLPFVTLFDLDTSLELNNETSELGIFVRYLGEAPGYLIVILALSVFIIHLLRKPFESNYSTKANLGILFFINYGLLYTIATYLDKYFTAHDFIYFDRTIVSIIFSIIYSYSILRVYKSEFQPNNNHLYFAALTMLVILLYPLLTVQTIKTLWGRVRFNDLSNIDAFTAWYLPQGVTGNRSFISGHASMGVMVWGLTPLFRKYSQNSQIIIKIILFSWALIVALGRIIIGAHYLSDVFFSIGIGFGIFYLVNRRLKDKFPE